MLLFCMDTPPDAILRRLSQLEPLSYPRTEFEVLRYRGRLAWIPIQL